MKNRKFDVNTDAAFSSAESYRQPMSITERYRFRSGEVYSACPRCRLTLEREYQSFCDRCGQALNWKAYKKALLILRF